MVEKFRVEEFKGFHSYTIRAPIFYYPTLQRFNPKLFNYKVTRTKAKPKIEFPKNLLFLPHAVLGNTNSTSL